ncbi:hypothetical protein KSP40_PGU002240 [Platanthera guangdongensis]|uniref:Uncharacterized protein n=1 Tax=Platanthera guangdongensis TaxID=2320717 RepID=A0ABR2M0R2_9ASPA
MGYSFPGGKISSSQGKEGNTKKKLSKGKEFTTCLQSPKIGPHKCSSSRIGRKNSLATVPETFQGKRERSLLLLDPVQAERGSHHPWRSIPGDLGQSVAEDASPDYNSSCIATRFLCWAIPSSLAVTRGILISFFSSAY